MVSFDDLKHAYDKFRLTGNVNKLPFDELYLNVKTYINDVLPKKISNKYYIYRTWLYRFWFR